MLTPQDRGLCEESNEINGEKIVLCSTAEKKNCLLWISSEKNYMFKLAVEKEFDHKEKP